MLMAWVVQETVTWNRRLPGDFHAVCSRPGKAAGILAQAGSFGKPRGQWDTAISAYR